VEDIMASLNKPGFQQIRQLGINEKLHASTFETVLTWVKRAA
jgi:lambda repressor-like predicted transcriptional regulator